MGTIRSHHVHMVRPKSDWFAAITATECLVFVSIVLLFLAVLVPTVRSQWVVSDQLQARSDIQRLHDALLSFHRDMGFMPAQRPAGPQIARISSLSAARAPVLVSVGRFPTQTRDPACREWFEAPREELSRHLVNTTASDGNNEFRSSNWKGPYLADAVRADPWGNCYVINIANFGDKDAAEGKDPRDGRAVFILSAGPNGQIDTPCSQSILTAHATGDDIAVCLP